MKAPKRAIEITRREVMNNIIRFQDTLLKSKGHPQELGKGRSYPVMLNFRTGDFRFAEEMSNLEHHFASPQTIKQKAALEEWRNVQLQIWQRTKNHWECTLCDETDHKLRPRNLEPLAWRIIEETVDVLNEILQAQAPKTTESLPEKAALTDLSAIHLSTHPGSIEDLPGWKGPLDRFEAEASLKKAPKGTYVLRSGDEETKAVAFQLSQENGVRVKAYVCTVVESEKKISDILILHSVNGWTLYDDNPDLTDSQYIYSPSPQGVMLQLHDRAKRAL